jgi:hypothetical protein
MTEHPFRDGILQMALHGGAHGPRAQIFMKSAPN